MNNSIILNQLEAPCFAETADKSGCMVLSEKNEKCGTCECPFFKPKGCSDWIRTQRGSRISIMPPEEYRGQ